MADGIAEMRRLTEEAIRAGAFGCTTSRTNAHKTTSGEMVPGRCAERSRCREKARTYWVASTARKRAVCAPLETFEWIANCSRLD